jgi:hypothetical protein
LNFLMLLLEKSPRVEPTKTNPAALAIFESFLFFQLLRMVFERRMRSIVNAISTEIKDLVVPDQ